MVLKWYNFALLISTKQSIPAKKKEKKIHANFPAKQNVFRHLED